MPIPVWGIISGWVFVGGGGWVGTEIDDHDGVKIYIP